MHSKSLPALKSARLLDQVRERIRYLHYSIRTEDAYVHWIKAFIRFHDRRHPGEMGGPEVEAYLTWLANERGVAISTHRQALSAILFLYAKVLGQDLPWMHAIGRPRPNAWGHNAWGQVLPLNPIAAQRPRRQSRQAQTAPQSNSRQWA